MKWLMVVISLVSTTPQDDRDMWVVAKMFDSEQLCIEDANINTLGLMARAHEEYNYRNRFPDIAPWDAWQIYCVNGNVFKELMKETGGELGT
jgi:hypothetical protein